MNPIEETYQITANGDVILDPSLNHEYTGEETVTDTALIIIVGVLPFFIITAIGFVLGPMFDAHSGICVLITAMGGTRFFTEYLKLWVGRFRPNFYSMCEFNPDPDSLQCTTEDEVLMLDARHSFPSGHSSMAFCGMTVLSLWFLGKVGVRRKFLFRNEEMQHNDLGNFQNATYYKVTALLSCLPFMCIATYIAASRVRDFYHHADDVIAGALLGISCSFFSYHIWYPSIFSSLSGIPIHTLLQDIAEGRNAPSFSMT